MTCLRNAMLSVNEWYIFKAAEILGKNLSNGKSYCVLSILAKKKKYYLCAIQLGVNERFNYVKKIFYLFVSSATSS